MSLEDHIKNQVLDDESKRIITHVEKFKDHIQEYFITIAKNSKSQEQWDEIIGYLGHSIIAPDDKKFIDELVRLALASQHLARYSSNFQKRALSQTRHALIEKKSSLWMQTLRIVEPLPEYSQVPLLKIARVFDPMQFESFVKKLKKDLFDQVPSLDYNAVKNNILDEKESLQKKYPQIEKRGNDMQHFWELHLAEYAKKHNLPFEKIRSTQNKSIFRQDLFMVPEHFYEKYFENFIHALLHEDLCEALPSEENPLYNKGLIRDTHLLTPSILSDSRLTYLLQASFQGKTFEFRKRHQEVIPAFTEIRSLQKNRDRISTLSDTEKALLCSAMLTAKIPESKDLFESIDRACFTTHYRIHQTLGYGTQSRVYRVKNRHGKEFAMKVYNDFDTALREAQRLTQTYDQDPHPNILPFYFTNLLSKEVLYNDQSVYCMFSKYINGKTIEQLMQEGSSDKLRTIEFIGQMTSAIKWFQVHDIFHRDLTDRNIMLDMKSNTFKIIDFGIATTIDNSPEYNPRFGGKTDFESLARLIYNVYTNELLPRQDELKLIQTKLPKKVANITSQMFKHLPHQPVEPIYQQVTQMYLDEQADNIAKLSNPFCAQNIGHTLDFFPKWVAYLTKPSQRFEQ